MNFEQIIFTYPRWVLLLFGLLAVACGLLIWWRWLQRRPQTALRFSSVAPLLRQRRGFGVRARHAIPVLRTLAVGLLILCLARPEKGNEKSRIYAEGIAIQMVVDLSGSMEAKDYRLEGVEASRLDVVKRIFSQFVEGDNDELAGRPDDLVGLIGFARYADSLAPLTLDHENVLAILAESETAQGPTVRRRYRDLEQALIRANAEGNQRRVRQIQAEAASIEEENQTAIGDAVALAVERLRDLDRQTGRDAEHGVQRQDHKIKSKIIILLTDGHQNAGDLTLVQAGELAKASGIKIYTIGMDSQRYGGAGVDLDEMRKVAELTGGKQFLATNTRSLHEVYAQIDSLEKTQTEERRYLQRKPIAISATSLGRLRVPPLLLFVVVLLVLEVVLSNTRLRRIP